MYSNKIFFWAKRFLFVLVLYTPVFGFAQFGADYSSYGFNFVDDAFNDGLIGWQGTEIGDASKVNVYRQNPTVNDYGLELKALNETVAISYNDAGYMDLNPCGFIINLRLNLLQYTGGQDAFIFKLWSGSKLVSLRFQQDGIYYLDGSNNTVLVTNAAVTNQFLTYTISLEDCGSMGNLMIENNSVNTFPLDLPNDLQSPSIELAASTDAASEFETEVDHLFIYSNPIKWWLGPSVPYGGESNYVGTTGDRQHFLNLPNGERIGINENGGGYMTYTQLSPTGTNLYPNPKFGSGGTKTLRGYFHSSDYNPVQAGASSTTGGHLVTVNDLGMQLEIEPFPLHLYYKSGITEHNLLVFPSGDVMTDFDNTTDDEDIYDEFGLDMRHEIITELDFSSTLKNVSTTGGISVVQHVGEWEFIRHPCQLLQYHEPTANNRFNLDGTPHSDTDMGAMRHKFEFRMNKDLGYEWVLWRENGQWESMQFTTVGQNKKYDSSNPATIPLESRFMVFSTSNSLTDPNAIAWYYPESTMNANCTVQKSRLDKSVVSQEDRRYKVQIIADWRKTNWCRMNLYVFNNGLLAPNHGDLNEYESFQMEAYQLFGTPEQIWARVQGITLPIELIAFEANATTNNQVALGWSTASETNNDFFTTERSKDGLQWEIVDRITATGNSQSTTQYASIDEAPFPGTSFYRLRQTDHDGNTTLSRIKAVTIQNPASTPIKVFPNPTDDLVYIYTNKKEVKKLVLLDGLGQDVTHKIIHQAKTRERLTLSFRKLQKGLYYLVVNEGTVFKVLKN